MVKHEMGLFTEGYNMIADGKKQVEIRLYDEKRQKIEAGHSIVFYHLPERKETITVLVTAIKWFKGFEELYKATDFALLGRADKSAEWMLNASYDFYKRDDELKYGVVAIAFEPIK